PERKKAPLHSRGIFYEIFYCLTFDKLLYERWLFEFFYFDILKIHFITMILKQNVPGFKITEIHPVFILAIIDKSIPHLIVTCIFDDFHIVQPMLHLISFYNNRCLVEESRTERLVCRSRYKIIQRTQFSIAVHTQLGVRMHI